MYNYLRKKSTASTVFSFSYLAHRRCEGYGRVYDPGGPAQIETGGGWVIERPRARRENRGM